MTSSHKESLADLQLIFRSLTEQDAESYRALRLKALETEGRFFTASLQEEASRPLSEWAAACAETTGQVTFAAFQNNQLVAATSIEPFDGQTVKWKSTISEPAIRGRGVVERLFHMCTEWCREHGFEEAVFTIHPENVRSREIQEKNGAIKIGQEPMRFADGHVAPALWYRKNLNL